MTGAQPAAVAPADPVPTWLAWGGVVGLGLVGVLAGIVECVLVPLYVGGIVFPIAVVAALVSNILLPRMARRLVPSTPAAVVPFVGWLAVIVVFGALATPEGDVILPGGGALEYVSYGVMLGGAFAGVVAIVTSVPPPAPRAPVRTADVSAPRSGRPATEPGPTTSGKPGSRPAPKSGGRPKGKPAARSRSTRR